MRKYTTLFPNNHTFKNADSNKGTDTKNSENTLPGIEYTADSHAGIVKLCLYSKEKKHEARLGKRQRRMILESNHH